MDFWTTVLRGGTAQLPFQCAASVPQRQRWAGASFFCCARPGGLGGALPFKIDLNTPTSCALISYLFFTSGLHACIACAILARHAPAHASLSALSDYTSSPPWTRCLGLLRIVVRSLCPAAACTLE